MIHKILLLCLVLTLLAIPALAQSNTVAFDGVSFSLPPSLATNVNITQFPGDPTTLDQPGGPQVKHTEFVFYNALPAPQSLLDGVGGIQVYNLADFAGYTLASQELQGLQTLLAQHPDLGSFMAANQGNNANNLPFLPTQAAVQVIRARARYVDTATLHGVSYLTVYSQGPSPFLGNQFLYTFQGLSADGARYVTAAFHLNTALFPAQAPSDSDTNGIVAQYPQYLADSIAKLNSAAQTDFTPSLDDLDALFQSISFSGTIPAAPGATPQPQVTETPASAGILGGVTWQLQSYGDPANPTAALPSPPTTLSFTDTGISGNGGCNSYSGSFQFDQSSISFSNVIRTLMACDQPIQNQEDAYFAALASATSFQLASGQLQISYDGGVLTFAPAAQPQA